MTTDRLSVLQLCSAARKAGFALTPKVDGSVTMQRGDNELVVKAQRDGSVSISGKGSYMVLSQIFPDA